MTGQQRFAALCSLGLFVAIAIGLAPFVVAAFPLADLSQANGESASSANVLAAVQLYAVLCVSALLPAFLCTVWLRRFGGPLEAIGLSTRRPGGQQARPVYWSWIKGVVVSTVAIGGFCAMLAVCGWYQVEVGSFAPRVFCTVLFALLLAALYEELLFRGFGFWALSQVGGHSFAIVVSSVLFGMAHANNTGSHWVATLNTVLAGVLLAVLRWRSGSLWSAWGVHLGWNTALGLLFGARTSGFGFAGRLLDAELSEAGSRYVVLAGGNYGPEGSLLLTPLLLTWIVWLWRRSVREPKIDGQVQVERSEN